MKRISVLSLALFIASFLLLVVVPTPASAAVVCKPSSPVPYKIWSTSGPKSGELTLNWNWSENVDRYGIDFGYWSGKYQFGARRIGRENTTSYVVSQLTPGKKYYFRMFTSCGGSIPTYSKEFTGVAK